MPEAPPATAPPVLALRQLPDTDLLRTAADPVEAALAHVAGGAFAETSPVTSSGTASGRVGLELELHLVDLARPARRPVWDEVRHLVAALPPMPGGSPVTVEPGGQLELSTPVAADVEAAIALLAADERALRAAVAERGFGLAGLGTDPGRTPRRINPAPRYHAMEQHFDALGCVGAGRSMMTGTAAMQVNLDAGPASGWGERMAHLCRLVPVLVALSSTSPWLGGRSSGWHSMRQGVWQGIDPARTSLSPHGLEAGDPGEAWAAYALDAPVMLLLDDGAVRPVTRRTSFRSWLRGEGDLPRPPVLADLERHLTTLFPPVRPRGYLELRSMDAMPARWWPATVSVAVTLADDPVAVDAVAEACAALSAADGWERAAHAGLDDDLVRRTTLRCLEVAHERAPAGLVEQVGDLRALVESAGGPAGELRRRIGEVGPVATLQEVARG